MGGRGHRVALVENDKLDAPTHQLLGAAEALNLVSDDIDTAIVTGVQLKGHMLVIFWPVDFFGYRQHAGGLTSPRTTEKIGEDGNSTYSFELKYDTS